MGEEIKLDKVFIADKMAGSWVLTNASNATKSVVTVADGDETAGERSSLNAVSITDEVVINLEVRTWSQLDKFQC